MAGDDLMSAPVQRGRTVVDAARRQGMVVKGAFWSHDADTDRWRLVIVSPDAAQGTQPLLRKLVAVLDLDVLSGVEIKAAADQLFADIQNAPGVSSSEGKHVRSLLSGGRYIDDAFMYAL